MTDTNEPSIVQDLERVIEDRTLPEDVRHSSVQLMFAIETAQDSFLYPPESNRDALGYHQALADVVLFIDTICLGTFKNWLSRGQGVIQETPAKVLLTCEAYLHTYYAVVFDAYAEDPKAIIDKTLGVDNVSGFRILEALFWAAQKDSFESFNEWWATVTHWLVVRSLWRASCLELERRLKEHPHDKILVDYMGYRYSSEWQKRSLVDEQRFVGLMENLHHIRKRPLSRLLWTRIPGEDPAKWAWKRTDPPAHDADIFQDHVKRRTKRAQLAGMSNTKKIRAEEGADGGLVQDSVSEKRRDLMVVALDKLKGISSPAARSDEERIIMALDGELLALLVGYTRFEMVELIRSEHRKKRGGIGQEEYDKWNKKVVCPICKEEVKINPYDGVCKLCGSIHPDLVDRVNFLTKRVTDLVCESADKELSEDELISQNNESILDLVSEYLSNHKWQLHELQLAQKAIEDRFGKRITDVCCIPDHLYGTAEMTVQERADKLGLSKSTVERALKQIRGEYKQEIRELLGLID